MHLYQKVAISFSDSKEKDMYQEFLSFDGALTFASKDELIVEKTDGCIFRTPISHYDSDILFETYVGQLFGRQFRFLFASKTNPISDIDPMVTFASMATSGWALHFRVRP